MSVAAPSPLTRSSGSFKFRAIAVQARAIPGSDVMMLRKVAATIPVTIVFISYNARAEAVLTCDPRSTLGVISMTVAAVCPATLRTVSCTSGALAVLDRTCAGLACRDGMISTPVVAVCPAALMTTSYRSRAPTVLNSACTWPCRPVICGGLGGILSGHGDVCIRLELIDV